MVEKTLGNLAACPECGKLVKHRGLAAHRRVAHTPEGKALLLSAQEANRERGRKTQQAKQIQREMNPPKIGGYRGSGGGLGRSGRFENIWFDSRWELAYYLWCKHNNISIKRVDTMVAYTLDGVERRYLPDFIVNDETIIEIKGRDIATPEVQAKFDAIPTANKMLLLSASVRPIYDWANAKFGELSLLYDSPSYNTHVVQYNAYKASLPKKQKCPKPPKAMDIKRTKRAAGELPPTKRELKAMAAAAIRAELNVRLERLEELKTDPTVDFTKYGWVQRVAEHVGITHVNVVKWLKREAPDFLATCYQRKSRMPVEKK